MVWIVGTRMIHQGKDGLSQGDTNGLATSGVYLSSILPLHLSEAERAPKLLELIKDWVALPELHILSLEGWFTDAHTHGAFSWFPAAAADDTAIDQFCEALHKRPYGFHVFAIPLLMTNRWQKQLLNVTDANLVVKPCTEIWGASQHEPFDVFISLPICRQTLASQGNPAGSEPGERHV
jgi:hypothetical protein